MTCYSEIKHRFAIVGRSRYNVDDGTANEAKENRDNGLDIVSLFCFFSVYFFQGPESS